jgi:tetraacyldisaccharide 4'-kinase
MQWERVWYTDQGWHYPLIPLSWLYQSVAAWRRRRAQRRQPTIHVPIIVVGNLTVGGTGKTPLVIKLAQYLSAQRFKVGIVSRGYGGRAPYYPYPVTATGNPRQVGDEPVVIAQRTGLPVVVAPERNQAVQYLIERHGCDIILSDDGLQHYAMPRAFEIAVIDGERGFGNEYCLPAGPLREPCSRLAQVDLVVVNTPSRQTMANLQQRYALPHSSANDASNIPWLAMQMVPGRLINLCRPEFTFTSECLRGKTLHAVAAIGHPERFFQTLHTMQLTPQCHAFADHHMWQPHDLAFGDDAIVVMTEKDAVKCRSWATPNLWYLPVDAQLTAADSDILWDSLYKKITAVSDLVGVN